MNHSLKRQGNGRHVGAKVRGSLTKLQYGTGDLSSRAMLPPVDTEQERLAAHVGGRRVASTPARFCPTVSALCSLSLLCSRISSWFVLRIALAMAHMPGDDGYYSNAYDQLSTKSQSVVLPNIPPSPTKNLQARQAPHVRLLFFLDCRRDRN